MRGASLRPWCLPWDVYTFHYSLSRDVIVMNSFPSVRGVTHFPSALFDLMTPIFTQGWWCEEKIMFVCWYVFCLYTPVLSFFSAETFRRLSRSGVQVTDCSHMVMADQRLISVHSWLAIDRCVLSNAGSVCHTRLTANLAKRTQSQHLSR